MPYDSNPTVDRIIRRNNYRSVNPFLFDTPVGRGLTAPLRYGAAGVGRLGSAVMFNRYGASLGFGAMGMAFGEDPITAASMGVGFLGAQIATDIAPKVMAGPAAVLAKAGKGVGGMGRMAHGLPFLPAAKGEAAKQVAKTAVRGMSTRGLMGTGLRAAGSGLRLAGAMSTRVWTPLMIGSVVGALMPEGHPVREASDYIFGMKAGEWIGEQMESLSLQKKGGFGMAKATSSQAVMRSREISKMLIGQSTTASLLGREAEMMHN